MPPPACAENSRRRLPDVLGTDVRRILVKAAQRAAHVAFQFLLRDARLLKIQDVVKSARRHRAHQLGRLHRRARHEWGIDADHALDAIRVHQRRIPRRRAAPVVADDDAFVDAERVEHPDDVGDDLPLGVSLDGLGAIGFAIAALVGRDGAKSCVGERANLMTPGIPEFREAMAHHHGKTLPASTRCIRMPLVLTNL